MRSQDPPSRSHECRMNQPQTLLQLLQVLTPISRNLSMRSTRALLAGRPEVVRIVVVLHVVHVLEDHALD